MADNVTLNSGTGGAVLAADDIAGVWYVIQKVAYGALDSATLAASGAGAVSAGVQRITLASDDPAVAALQILDNAIAGTEMQVDVVAALPAGNNNIGDVDVASLPATTVAGATVKTADLDSGAGTDTVPILGVAVAAAGGAVAVTGDATNGLDVDVTRVTGTVTVANGGTFATQVNGDALTALQLIDNLVLAEDAIHATADPGVQALAVRKATPANLSGADGDYEPLQVNAGRLWVDPSGVTLTVASHAVTNAGTFATQVDGAALTALQKIDDPVLVDDAAFTPATSSVMMAGFEADETATDSVDEGDAGAARMTLDRKQIVAQYAHAAGGASFYNLTDVQEVASQVKGSAGTIYSLYAWNLTAGPLWLKIYNALAVNVTPGTTAPDIDLMIPANADSDGAGVVIPIPVAGLAFGTAITITGSATRGTTAVDVGAAGNMGVFISYA